MSVKSNAIITIDQSTSGTKVLLINEDGLIKKRLSKSHKQIYLESSWVEHNPVEIYENVKMLLNTMYKNIREEYNVKVLSITNQRETTVIWDRKTGKPLYNAIVWQCRRTTRMCHTLIEKGYNDIVHEKTGLKIDPYFSATKIRWLFENVQAIKEHTNMNDILVGTIDSWLIWKLTNGKVHATDYTNASRTLLFNIYTLKWDDELLSVFNVPSSSLPEVRSSNDLFGSVQDSEVVCKGIPISGVIGDSQAALFGQQCFERGMAKATYGTGTSVMIFTKDPIHLSNKLINSIAWGIDGEVYYAAEGIINMTGDTINWLIDDLELFENVEEVTEKASELQWNEGVYLIPAFVGLSAPHWEPEARAEIVGLSRSSTKSHFARAALESIAYQVKDIFEVLEKNSELNVKKLIVDGGATGNEILMQFQSDILNMDVNVSSVEEVSGLGSSYLAGMGVGIWENVEDLKSNHIPTKDYQSKMIKENRQTNYSGWKHALCNLINNTSTEENHITK